MEERQLLLFRWEGETYGVPVEEVIGIVSKAGTDDLVIITNVNGVQMMIIADEIIPEKKFIRNNVELNAAMRVLQIWKFKQEQFDFKQ